MAAVGVHVELTVRLRREGIAVQIVNHASLRCDAMRPVGVGIFVKWYASD